MFFNQNILNSKGGKKRIFFKGEILLPTSCFAWYKAEEMIFLNTSALKTFLVYICGLIWILTSKSLELLGFGCDTKTNGTVKTL